MMERLSELESENLMSRLWEGQVGANNDGIMLAL